MSGAHGDTVIGTSSITNTVDVVRPFAKLIKFIKFDSEVKSETSLSVNYVKKNLTIDTCWTSANLAWEALKNFGNSAYDEYWAKKIPPPIKCEKGCKCGPENYLTTFDWENETIIYEYNGSAQSSVTIDFENKTIIYEDNGSEVNGAQSSVPGFFALSITLFSSFFVIANF